MGLVKNDLYSQLCAYFRAGLDWQSFCQGGPLGSPDSVFSGVCTMFRGNDGILQWAMSLNVKDPSFSRRRWKYYIGMTQQEPDELIFSYAKCCYDHMAGSISAPKPIITFQDHLIRPLLISSSFQFMCGSQPYPMDALALTPDTLKAFLGMILDEKRTVPIMLITCPDIISPQKMNDLCFGNLIVFWCEDSRLILHLNGILPEGMYTPWDSVHILMPITQTDSFHPIHSYEDIHHMGIENFIAGIRQAYCQSMRSEERKLFPTVENVNRRRDQAYIRTLLEQRDAQKIRLLEQTKQISDQAEELQSAQYKLQAYQTAHPEGQISEYETLLNDALTEADSLKKGIAELSSRIFSNMGIGFRPKEEQTVPCLQELEHAIYSALACANERK